MSCSGPLYVSHWKRVFPSGWTLVAHLCRLGCFSLSCQVSWCTRLSHQMKVPWLRLLGTLALYSAPAHLRPSLWSKWAKSEFTAYWLFWTSAMSARGCLLLVGATSKSVSFFSSVLCMLTFCFIYTQIPFPTHMTSLRCFASNIHTLSLISFKLSPMHKYVLHISKNLIAIKKSFSHICSWHFHRYKSP